MAMNFLKDWIIQYQNKFSVGGVETTIDRITGTVSQEGDTIMASYLNEIQKNGLYNVNATRVVEGTVEFYDIAIEGSDIFDVFDTQFIINFNETNTKLNPVLRFNGNNYYIRFIENFIDIDVPIGYLQKTYICFLDSTNNKLKLMNHERKLTFDTIADAQAYSGFVAGDRIQVLGYYSKNDEAGHERVYSLIDDGSGIACGVGYLNYSANKGKLIVKHFGVRENEVGDTSLIQKAINYSSGKYIVVFTKGTYLINGNYSSSYVGISIPSNTHIKIHKTAIIKADTNSTTAYSIFTGSEVDNVIIEGFNSYLIGERDTHIGTTGEGGVGIGFMGSTNITVKGLYCKNFWGDGIIFMNSGNTISKNIKVLDCTCDNNRRQGMSVGSTVNMEIRNCIFINTNGTSPESGIDFEPNPTRPINENILVDNCHFENNRNCAINIPFGSSHKNIKITNCTMIAKTGENLFGYGLNAISNNIDNNLIIENCKIIGPNYIQGAKVLNTEFTINDNYPSNNWAIIDAVNVQSIYENITVHSFDAKRCINIGGGLSEKTRKFIKNMTIIKYGNTPTVPYLNSLLDYVTVENCKFLNSGLLPTTKYYNSVSANGLGDKCVFLNTFFDEGWQLNNKSNFMATYNSDNLAKVNVNPTAGENFRGMISIVEGGTDVADSVRICVKGSDNLYSWKTFVLT